VPYVLATDIVRARPGEGFPVDELARALARRLGENGTGCTPSARTTFTVTVRS